MDAQLTPSQQNRITLGDPNPAFDPGIWFGRLIDLAERAFRRML